MNVKECMTKDVELADLNMTVRQAARKMRDGDFGALPVGDNDKLVGMITDRDIVIRLAAEGLDPNETKISEVMSDKVLYCFEDRSIDEVARNMGDLQVRRLPVLNRQKRLVGIVSLGDLALAEVRGDHMEEALSDISEKDKNEARRGA